MMSDSKLFNPPILVDPFGRPVTEKDLGAGACPGCGSSPDDRVASGGFGTPHEVCKRCGHEFYGQEMRS
jgi:hypothetical protein